MYKLACFPYNRRNFTFWGSSPRWWSSMKLLYVVIPFMRIYSTRASFDPSNSPMMIKIEKHDASAPPKPIVTTFPIATNFSVLLQRYHLIIPIFNGYNVFLLYLQSINRPCQNGWVWRWLSTHWYLSHLYSSPKLSPSSTWCLFQINYVIELMYEIKWLTCGGG